MVQTELSFDEKTEVLQVLRELDPTREGIPPEMRRARRRGVLEWLPIQTLPRETEARRRLFRVLVKDVSAGGVGIYSRRTFAAGEEFVLPIRFAEGGGKLFLCKVTFCRRSSPRHYAVGARFVDAIDDPAADAGIPDHWM